MSRPEETTRGRGRSAGRPPAWALGLAGAALLLLGPGGPPPVAAWPAVSDGAGLYLCDTRPREEGPGRWSCRSAGVLREGALIDVTGGPAGLPPGYRGHPRGPAPVPPPYWGPWGWGPGGRPRGPESGYDELDPWLGPRGPSER
jgi:hypothetical protein